MLATVLTYLEASMTSGTCWKMQRVCPERDNTTTAISHLQCMFRAQTTEDGRMQPEVASCTYVTKNASTCV